MRVEELMRQQGFSTCWKMHGLGHLNDRTVLEIGYGRLSQALMPSQRSAEVASAIDEKGRLRDSLSIDGEHQARRSSQYVRIRGGGKPIVSVPLDFADDAQPFVRTARDADDWIAAIEEAQTLDPPTHRVARHPRPHGVRTLRNAREKSPWLRSNQGSSKSGCSGS